MSKYLIRACTLLLSCLACGQTWANDGAFAVNGNQLIPLQEADVAIVKEVLTITLCDDDTARVDVYYEMDNRGEAKTVDVGFVAYSPYNMYDHDFNPSRHPYMEGFTVEMNGTSLPVNSYVMAREYDKEPDFKPLDVSQWRGYSPQLVREMAEYDEYPYDGSLYRREGDFTVVTGYAYAYCFKAHFNKGKNIIHHTYRYVMSYSLNSEYEIPYTLTPAMKWANKQIDDFTLRIKAENTAKHFLVERDALPTGKFVVTSGTGKVRTHTSSDESLAPSREEVALRNGTVEWHCKNYRTTYDMMIRSADLLYWGDVYGDTCRVGTFYERSTTSFKIEPQEQVEVADGLDVKRVKRNLPYAHRGYVFRDKQLQKYFNSLFWYMPDPEWKMSTDDFTPAEWKLIKGE